MQDLFTVKYPYYPSPVPGWQMGLPHGMGLPRGMGISMQYNNMVVLLQSKMISLQDYLNLWLVQKCDAFL